MKKRGLDCSERGQKELWNFKKGEFCLERGRELEKKGGGWGQGGPRGNPARLKKKTKTPHTTEAMGGKLH